MTDLKALLIEDEGHRFRDLVLDVFGDPDISKEDSTLALTSLGLTIAYAIVVVSIRSNVSPLDVLASATNAMSQTIDSLQTRIENMDS